MSESQEQRPRTFISAERQPAVFVLEAVYKGEPQVVADGVAFPTPSEAVVINWLGDSSIEVLGSVEELYEKFSGSIRILWRRDEDQYTESEPSSIV